MKTFEVPRPFTPRFSHPAAFFRRASAATGLALLGAVAATQASTDYAPAIWTPLSNYYTTGYGHKFLVIHDMEGWYGNVVAVFNGNGTSVHYAVNSGSGTSAVVNGHTYTDSDGKPPGEITQMVREDYYAWDATCWNHYHIGTEHEGFRDNPAWYTEAQYQASALLQRHLCDKYAIAKDRNHIVGHDAKSSAAWVNYANANFGINASCNTHNDPGPYWDWSHFMTLIIGTSMHDLGNKVAFNPATAKGYELDAYGGITPINGAPTPTGAAYWPGWDIARDFAITSWSTPPKGYTMDAFGGLNPFGGQAAATGGPYWSGWDIARALQVDTAAGNKGYVLDGFGAVHPFNGAPAITSGPSWNWDIARDLVTYDYATGKGYVLDGFGGVGPVNGAPAVTTSAYWAGWDIARALVMNPTTLKGYVLDGLGALHPVNGAPTPSGVAGFSFDIARDVVITDWTTPKGYTLDGYGAWHPFGGAPAVTGAPWFSW